MKALFLDINGVIVTPQTMRLNYLMGRGPERQRYDPVALGYLGRLVRETGARVVLASTWRSASGDPNPEAQAIMRNLFDQLAAAGAPVSDATPLVFGGDRSDEVGAWLDAHPCEAYAIVDDLARFENRPEVADGHLVVVRGSEGFRSTHYRQARALLAGAVERQR